MIRRTIEISGEGNHLYISQGRFCIRRGRQVIAQIPAEDVGVLILDAPTTTYTHAVLVHLLQAGAAVVLCGKDHHPCGLFLPQGNTLQTQRLAAQARAPLPLRKQLWKQLVQAKIRNQAHVLPQDSPLKAGLPALAGKVRSGDPANVEAQAARRYWPAMFGKAFRRHPQGPPPNNLLNYGYMALRAAVARAICGAGLHPSLGLHHHNRSNTFCLADDLLEPLRPLVDRQVRRLWLRGTEQIDRETKIALLSTLTEEVEVAGEKGPLMVALERTTASLVRCYARQQKKLDLPKPCS